MMVQAHGQWWVPDLSYTSVVVCHNSERLTMAFELIGAPSGTPLCIVQDLQVWDVCHNAIEIIPR
jgi:hypothetical protein